MANVRLGIMQGRLVPPSEPNRIQSFPRAGWGAEFGLAARAGLSCIEWIYDSHGEDVNPIAHGSGIATMKEFQQEHNVAVVSLVADYYMDHLLTSGQDIERHLKWLLGRCELAGIRRIVLPFVDSSSMSDETQRAAVLRILERAAPDAEASSVELHLETDLPPVTFASFLTEIDHPVVRVNYDSGNSASLGFDAREEFAA